MRVFPSFPGSAWEPVLEALPLVENGARSELKPTNNFCYKAYQITVLRWIIKIIKKINCRLGLPTKPNNYPRSKGLPGNAIGLLLCGL